MSILNHLAYHPANTADLARASSRTEWQRLIVVFFRKVSTCYVTLRMTTTLRYVGYAGSVNCLRYTVFCPHWSAVVNTDHHSAASDQYSALPDHHSFYQYIYRSSLSSYARVAIVYLALFFLHPMGHGSSHARSRST